MWEGIREGVPERQCPKEKGQELQMELLQTRGSGLLCQTEHRLLCLGWLSSCWAGVDDGEGSG